MFSKNIPRTNSEGRVGTLVLVLESKGYLLRCAAPIGQVQPHHVVTSDVHLPTATTVNSQPLQLPTPRIQEEVSPYRGRHVFSFYYQ